jgi:hypothetical protein
MNPIKVETNIMTPNISYMGAKWNQMLIINIEVARLYA